MKRIGFVAVAIVTVLASGLLLAQSDPFIGTWKLDPAKSKYSPGVTPFQNLTFTYGVAGNGVKFGAAGTNVEGGRMAWNSALANHGEDNPVSGTGVPGGADAVALRRVDASTIDATFTKGGKVVTTALWVLSDGGNVLTVTASETNTHKPRRFALVFKRR